MLIQSNAGCASMQPFHLALCDYDMPRMRGDVMTAQYRAWRASPLAPRSARSRASGGGGGGRGGREQLHLPAECVPLPILALSAAVWDDCAADCREAGMNGFLPKPLKISQLKEAIRSLNVARTPLQPPPVR